MNQVPDQKKHDWGPIARAPYVDGGECRRCGLVLSAVYISMWREESLPECEAK